MNVRVEKDKIVFIRKKTKRSEFWGRITETWEILEFWQILEVVRGILFRTLATKYS